MWYEMKLVGLWGHLNSQWGYEVIEYRLWSQMDLSLNSAFLELCDHGPNTGLLVASVSPSEKWEW